MFLSVSYLLSFCFLVLVAAFYLYVILPFFFFFFNYNTGQSSLIISLQHHSLESAPLWREVNIFGALQLQLCSFNVVIDTRIFFSSCKLVKPTLL